MMNDMLNYLYDQMEVAENNIDKCIESSDGYTFWLKRIRNVDAIINVIIIQLGENEYEDLS